MAEDSMPAEMPDWWHELARMEMRLLAADPRGEMWPRLAEEMAAREAQGEGA